MITELDAFDASPLLAYLASPLNARAEEAGPQNIFYLLSNDSGTVGYYNSTFGIWVGIASDSGKKKRRLAWHDGFIFAGGDSAHRYSGAASTFDELDLEGTAIRESDLLENENDLIAGITDDVVEDPYYGIYDSSNLEFTNTATSSTGTGKANIAVIESNIYLIVDGGNILHYDGTGTLDLLSPTGPVGALGGDSADVDTLFGEIYIAGFYDSHASTPNLPAITKYNPTTNVWSIIDTTIQTGTPSGDDYKFKPETDGSVCVWEGNVYIPGYRWDSSSTATNGLLKVTSSSVELILETTTRSGTSQRVIGCKPAGDNLMIVGNFTSITDPNTDPSPTTETVTGVVLWDGAGTFTTLANQSGNNLDCFAILGTDVAPDLDNPSGNELIPTSAYSRQLADSNGTTMVAWNLDTGPSGMTLSSTGLLEWASPTKTGNPHSIRAYGANGTFYDVGTWNIYVHDTAPAIDALSDDAHGGGWYSRSPTTSAGDTPMTWSLITGPSGMSINTSNGTVQGNLNVEGVHDWTIRATNGAGYDEESWQTTVTF